MKKIIIFTIILFLAGNGFSAIYDSLALRIMNSAGHNPRNIGFVVRKISDGSEIVSINGDRQFIPASLQKLFTGAAAFDKLGVNFRAATRIFAENFDRATGEVKGDLYIVGAGDPGISAERLWLLAQHLRHLGVKKINGRLVIDNSLFSDETIPPGYGDSESGRAFMAPISAFAVSFNATSVVVSPSVAGQNAHIHLFPLREDVNLRGSITTAERGKELSVATRRHTANGMEVVLDGVVKPNAAPRYVYRQVWEPVINAAESFRSVLKEAGIEAGFSVALGQVDTTKTELILSFNSEPLTEMSRGMFKFSNNFGSEMVFLMLAAQSQKTQANFELGSQVVQNWWKVRFPESGEITAINGSGMGAGNQASAGQFADLLGWAYRQDWFFEFISMQPIAGVDGTLSTRFRNTELRGNLRAKTGTLNTLGVSSLAGYFRVNGELYSVVFIANDRATTQYSKWMLSENLLSGIKRAIERTGR